VLFGQPLEARETNMGNGKFIVALYPILDRVGTRSQPRIWVPMLPPPGLKGTPGDGPLEGFKLFPKV